MPLYVGDYLADTMHLTRDEHGAYLLLLMAYWRRGGPLPDEAASLAAIAHASIEEWMHTLCTRIKPFFHVVEGLWHHKRVDSELAKANRIIEQKTKAANSRWNSKNASAYASAMHMHPSRISPSPSPSHINTGGSNPPPPFTKEDISRVLDGYPSKMGILGAHYIVSQSLLRLREEGNPDPIGYLVAAVKRYAGSDVVKRIKKPWGPKKFFEEGHYDDDPEAWADTKPKEEKGNGSLCPEPPGGWNYSEPTAEERAAIKKEGAMMDELKRKHKEKRDAECAARAVKVESV